MLLALITEIKNTYFKLYILTVTKKVITQKTIQN